MVPGPQKRGSGVPPLLSPFGRAIAALALGLGLVIYGGCFSPPVATYRPAHLAVENLTAYAWRIALKPMDGGAVQVISVEPHDSPSIEVPAGFYWVDQSIASPTARGTPPRRFTIQFRPGETYRWPLMTLLSQ